MTDGRVDDFHPLDNNMRSGAAAYRKVDGAWIPWDGAVNNRVWDPVGLSWVNETQIGGSVGIPVSGPINCKSVIIDLSATGTIVAAVASKRIKVYAVKLIVDAALSVSFRDGASTALEGAQTLAANGGYVENVEPPAFLFGTTAGNRLDLVIAGTGNARGRVSYWDDDAS